MPRFSKKAILEELTRLYPDAGPELNFTNPYETLIAVMLSAQCTDKMVNKVTPAVFARYPDAASMAQATVEDLHPMVKSCGFKSKAVNIIETCKLLMLRHGGEVPRTMEELTARFVETMYSRIFVWRDSIDNIIGYVNSKSLFEAPKSVEEALIKVDYVAETLPLQDLLTQFTKNKSSFAVVIDEFGGTAGIISL